MFENVKKKSNDIIERLYWHFNLKPPQKFARIRHSVRTISYYTLFNTFLYILKLYFLFVISQSLKYHTNKADTKDHLMVRLIYCKVDITY